MNLKNSETSTARLLRAITLNGFWKLRWYHTVLLWLMLAVYAWGASPYFMVYVVGMPEPGTAPRYTGTVRVEGELQRTRSGWIPPRYFIKTHKGEVEFHCGYLPDKSECGKFYDFPKIHPEYVYQIGYSRYWGVDYIKYPVSLSRFDVNGEPKVITFGRLLTLTYHLKNARWFCFLFLGYLWLIWMAYKASDPNRQPDPPYPAVQKEPLDSTGSTVNCQTPSVSPKPKSRRRSFFD